MSNPSHELIVPSDATSMSSYLKQNLLDFAERCKQSPSNVEWVKRTLPFTTKVCAAFCRSLLEGDKLSSPREDLAALFYPEQSRTLVRDSVLFGVVSSPVAVYKSEPRECLTRKLLQVNGDGWDIGAGDSDKEQQVAVALGSQFALEVQAEIRFSHKNGCPIKVMGIYYPPFPVPTEGGNGGWMYRYAVWK